MSHTDETVSRENDEQNPGPTESGSKTSPWVAPVVRFGLGVIGAGAIVVFVLMLGIDKPFSAWSILLTSAGLISALWARDDKLKNRIGTQTVLYLAGVLAGFFGLLVAALEVVLAP